MLKSVKEGKEKWKSASSATRYVLIGVAGLSLIAILITIIILATDANREEVVYPAVWENSRLSTMIKPTRYNVSLYIDMTSEKFWGDETINVDVLNRTSVFVIHAKDIHISTIEMYKIETDKKPKEVSISRRHNWTENMYHVIYLKKYIEVGRYQLKVEWEGKLEKKLSGLYLSTYKEHGKEKKVLSSQMQATAAREAIPCFDEPEFKAIFHMRITTETSYSLVLWNTNLTSQDNDFYKPESCDCRKWKTMTFEPSPIMSTYLLAFIVANFECRHSVIKSTLSKNDITIRVCGRPDPIETGDGQYALDKAKNFITYYEDYYQQPYPLSKCDNVAVPDFAAGAMENWGLIIYRENVLLYNEHKDEVSVKSVVNLVVGHELAHMWFGNLVTMKWWNDIWLNEGFATYAQGLGSKKSEPDWNYENFLIISRQGGLSKDSRSTSRPASVDVTDTSMIHNLFDFIAYFKGASLLTQLNMIMTEATFKDGLRAYLKKYKFSNANQTQLYKELNDEFTKTGTKQFTIEDIMNTWTLQMNFPRISVKKYSDKQLIMTQSRFLIPDGKDKASSSPHNYQWYVPIKYKTKSKSASAIEWVLPNHQLTVNYAQATDNYMFVNYNGNGFYVTDYSNDLWKDLITLLNSSDGSTALNTREKQTLLYDTELLVKAGHYQLDRNLELLEICSRYTTDYHTLKEVYKRLKEISKSVRNDNTISDQWTTKWAKKTSDLYEAVNKKPTKYVEQLMYTLVMSECLFYNAEKTVNCTSDAIKLWEKSKNKINPEAINPNIRESVYSFLVQDGNHDEKDWNEFWDMFEKSESQAKQNQLLTVLSNSKDESIIKKFISYCMDEKKVRKNMGLFTMGRSIALANGITAKVSLDFMLENWPKIHKTFITLDMERPIYILNVISQAASQNDYDKIVKKFETGENAYFKEPNKYVDVQKSYQEGLQKAKENIMWLDNNRKYFSG